MDELHAALPLHLWSGAPPSHIWASSTHLRDVYLVLAVTPPDNHIILDGKVPLLIFSVSHTSMDSTPHLQSPLIELYPACEP